MLASGSEFVDWRHWLLAASIPWPFPTQAQLLSLLESYKKADRKHTGYISEGTFLNVPLWFTIPKPQTPADPSQPHSFDRYGHLFKFWFELFSTNLAPTSHVQSDDKLDYKTMVSVATSNMSLIWKLIASFSLSSSTWQRCLILTKAFCEL